MPDWEVILDIDVLAKAEGEDWVWRGCISLPPTHRRGVVQLSRGGSDAGVIREFDLTDKRFIEAGFILPEAKGGAAWLDDNTLLISTDRLIAFEAAKQALERGAKENASFIGNDSGVLPDLNSKAKHLELDFTVEDEGAFTTPWSATVIYRPGMNGWSSSEFPEAVCAENPHELVRQAAVPTAASG
jgi:Prolyl oligopeptidase, N-terminal beta-propeller domain